MKREHGLACCSHVVITCDSTEWNFVECTKGYCGAFSALLDPFGSLDLFLDCFGTLDTFLDPFLNRFGSLDPKRSEDDENFDFTLVGHCATTRGKHLTCTVRDPSALAARTDDVKMAFNSQIKTGIITNLQHRDLSTFLSHTIQMIINKVKPILQNDGMKN
ncbi:hypothetical protein PV325_012521 [Microctonus aethiopoides]|nr:hypothetical protein PV325_012521 [Microctonus aethiopoides]